MEGYVGIRGGYGGIWEDMTGYGGLWDPCGPGARPKGGGDRGRGIEGGGG